MKKNKQFPDNPHQVMHEGFTKAVEKIAGKKKLNVVSTDGQLIAAANKEYQKKKK